MKYTKIDLVDDIGERDNWLSNYVTKIHAILKLFPNAYPGVSALIFNTLVEDYSVFTYLVDGELEIVFSDLFLSPFYLLFFLVTMFAELYFVVGTWGRE